MPKPITDEEKTRLLHQIFSLFVEHGINGISMDEVANHVNLSKATIYKYFKSKEDIVRDMMDEIIAHFNAIQFTTDRGIDDVLESMSVCYSKAVLATAFLSSKFLADLENKFPDIYDEYIIALESVQTRFVAFYKRASREGYCKKQISINLVVEQVKRTLPAIISSTYFNKHNTTLSVVIKEYYKLLLNQLLSMEYMSATAQKENYLFVNNVVEVLKSYFLI